MNVPSGKTSHGVLQRPAKVVPGLNMVGVLKRLAAKIVWSLAQQPHVQPQQLKQL